tara:strand:+ start:3927 stop:5063 length:1137 start_codon:yes stop_codon:yes gene_type:complete
LKKIFFLIWENPKSHQVILPLIKEISKNNKIYLISKEDKNIDNLNSRDSNLSKYCVNKKIFYSKNFKFLNKINLLYFYLISFLLIIFKRPKYIYILNNYPILLYFLVRIFINAKFIYHNLDYNPSPSGIFQNILKKIEIKFVKYFDLIIFSHQMRAKRFKQDAKLTQNNLVFFNSLPKDFYKGYKFKQKKNSNKKTIFYFGSIGPGHGLQQLVISSKYYDKNINLSIFGWVVDQKYYLKIIDLIKKNNLQSKVNIKINVQDFVWKSEILKCHLGIALYEMNSLSHKFMFTASQKINAYLAAGIPILVSHTDDNKNYLRKYKCGFSSRLNSKFIAKKINRIFKNKKNYDKIKKNSQKAFKNEFNFEKQYFRLNEKLNNF